LDEWMGFGAFEESISALSLCTIKHQSYSSYIMEGQMEQLADPDVTLHISIQQLS
jgi:hypothetical protein